MECTNRVTESDITANILHTATMNKTTFQAFTCTKQYHRLAGRNIRGFSVIKVFTEILSLCLGHKCSLFSTIKERRLYLRKKSAVLLKTLKNAKV